MSSKIVVSVALFLISCGRVFGLEKDSLQQAQIYWQLSGNDGIVWRLDQEKRLPHGDNMEMSGRKVSAIIHYRVEPDRSIQIERDVIFPQLQVFLASTESYWRRYRAYLRATYGDDLLPQLIVHRRRYEPGPVDSLRIAGYLQVFHASRHGLKLIRTLLPSMTERLFLEKWELLNLDDSVKVVLVGHRTYCQLDVGQKGVYERRIFCDAPDTLLIPPHGRRSFGIYFAARLQGEPWPRFNCAEIEGQRQQFLSFMQSNLVLETPDPILNRLFFFSKIRAAESIFDSKMGMVHSPGGGRYYCGVWANDQCEYSGPFFPYLGYPWGNEAALNAYRQFLRNLPEKGGHFWSSFEMEGDLTCCGADRGDAAMIAFGASHFAMASGDPEIGEELWPLITWSLNYCESQKNEEGVIRSDTDEMEGRIPTGDANLSTSCLYYGALNLAADLAQVLEKSDRLRREYHNHAKALRQAIEQYFGAEIEGLHTYKYFKEHHYLRHWICLPLVVDIHDRKEGTLTALFSKLWTPNGVRVELNPDLEEPTLFWDRGTLYAFRGAFRAGAADRALERLRSYSRSRLLGFHVPYVVEAWPEGNMAHLSAESALYCRIFIEGVLGITPKGFDSFELRPQLPAEWQKLSLRQIHAFGRSFNIAISRRGKGQLQLIVADQDKKIAEHLIHEGESIRIRFR